jgi:SAM-dependent methyltransferase
MDSRIFDKRGYPIVGAADGYGEWAATYEATVTEGLDQPLLERIHSVDWPAMRSAADLACGTGRTGRWLKNKGVARIDGIDITPAMLAFAKRSGVHDALHLADVRATPLPSSAIDLCTLVLADEHLTELGPVYREAWRLLRGGGKFVIVGYHPFFIMNGTPTHFHRDNDEAITIETYVHLFADHFKAGCDNGLTLIEVEECVVDED